MTRIALRAAVLLTALLVLPGLAAAKTAEEINEAVDAALERFYADVQGGREFVESSKGVLVFPEVIQAGLVIGGEYGEGALRMNGETAEYYSTAAGSFGLQAGAQAKTVIICFMTEDALRSFRNSSGWEAGVDGSVAIAQVGAGGSIDTTTGRSPIVGFVFGRRGVMVNLSLEGAKFTKIVR
ncbi:MAG: YSC84-related protein [Gammaproteobacteria bacterium]